MGASMAINLQKGGFEVYAYDMNVKVLENLEAQHVWTSEGSSF